MSRSRRRDTFGPMADQITIQIDRGHMWLLKITGAVVLLVAGFFQTLDIWDLQRRAALGERISKLEGQVKAISEAIQHEDSCPQPHRS